MAASSGRIPGLSPNIAKSCRGRGSMRLGGPVVIFSCVNFQATGHDPAVAAFSEPIAFSQREGQSVGGLFAAVQDFGDQ